MNPQCRMQGFGKLESLTLLINQADVPSSPSPTLSPTDTHPAPPHSQPSPSIKRTRATGATRTLNKKKKHSKCERRGADQPTSPSSDPLCGWPYRKKAPGPPGAPSLFGFANRISKAIKHRIEIALLFLWRRRPVHATHSIMQSVFQ